MLMVRRHGLRYTVSDTSYLVDAAKRGRGRGGDPHEAAVGLKARRATSGAIRKPLAVH